MDCMSTLTERNNRQLSGFNHETWVKILETKGYPAFFHRISRKPVYRNVVLTIKQRDILIFFVKPMQKLRSSWGSSWKLSSCLWKHCSKHHVHHVSIMNIAMTMNFIMVKRCVSTSCVSLCQNVRHFYSYHQEKVIFVSDDDNADYHDDDSNDANCHCYLCFVPAFNCDLPLLLLFLKSAKNHLPWDLTNQKIDGKTKIGGV